MRINKRTVTILIATLVLSIPAIYIKNLAFAQSPPQTSEPRFEVMLASDRAEKEAEEEKAAQAAAEAAKQAEAERVEQERIAAEQAAAEAQRVAAEQEAARVRAAQEAAAANCGPADPAYIYRVLIELGMSRTAAIQQVGSWKHESGLDPCQKRGDSGVAWGLNSWHPGRRGDMPENLREQIIWAVKTEMPRDCAECYQMLMSPNVSVSAARAAIQKSTRWGVEGNRWLYANEFMNIL